jgi:hypothetical protein
MEDFFSSHPPLSESEFQQEVAQNTASLGIDTTNGKIVYATAGAERLFQCKVKNGLNGVAFDELIPPELRGRHSRHVAAYLQDPHSRAMGEYGMTLRAQALDGCQFPVGITLLPLKKAERLYVILTIVPLPNQELS